ncbi:MAG: hypothetical protein ABFC77_13745 [Thermoguttaceae bacterium]
MFAMSRKLRWISLILVVTAIVIVLIVLGLYWAVGYEPAYYRNALVGDPAAMEQASDRMLQKTTALVSAVKKKGHWQVRFTTEQINGWLAVDRVRNHPKSLPPTLHDPRVVLDAHGITIACRYRKDGLETVLSMTFEPYLHEPNVVALRIIKARAGLLPAPLGPVIDHLSEAAEQLHFDLQWRRDGADPVALLSLPEGGNHRIPHIETLRLSNGELFVAGTTASKKQPEGQAKKEGRGAGDEGRK